MSDGWIKVSERKPEAHEDVLVFTKGGHVNIGSYFTYGDTKAWVNEKNKEVLHPTHWHPLPAPPVKPIG